MRRRESFLRRDVLRGAVVTGIIGLAGCTERNAEQTGVSQDDNSDSQGGDTVEINSEDYLSVDLDDVVANPSQYDNVYIGDAYMEDRGTNSWDTSEVQGDTKTYDLHVSQDKGSDSIVAAYPPDDFYTHTGDKLEEGELYPIKMIVAGTVHENDGTIHGLDEDVDHYIDVERVARNG